MCGPDDMKPTTVPYATPRSLQVNPTAGEAASVVLEEFPVEYDGYKYTGYVAYDPAAGPRPQVLVIPTSAAIQSTENGRDSTLQCAICTRGHAHASRSHRLFA